MVAKQKVHLGALLDFYGIRFAHKHGWQSIACCFHDERVPSLRVNLELGAFKCQACGAAGQDSIRFVELKENLGYREANEFLLQVPGDREEVEPEAYSRRTPARKVKFVPKYRRR